MPEQLEECEFYWLCNSGCAESLKSGCGVITDDQSRRYFSVKGRGAAMRLRRNSCAKGLQPLVPSKSSTAMHVSAQPYGIRYMAPLVFEHHQESDF